MSRYNSIKKTSNDNGKQVYQSVKLPLIEDLDTDMYIITNSMDRLDTLAYKFYGNAKYWWVIALANDLGKGTMMLEGGIQLKIPPNPITVEEKVQKENK